MNPFYQFTTQLVKINNHYQLIFLNTKEKMILEFDPPLTPNQLTQIAQINTSLNVSTDDMIIVTISI